MKKNFFLEILVPIVMYVYFMPMIAGPIWQNVESDPATPLWHLVIMHVLSVLMCLCWIEFYNCVLWGLFPPKRRR